MATINSNENSGQAKNLVKKILDKILDKADTSEDEKEYIRKTIEEYKPTPPLKIAIIGQSGVGKSSIANSIGLTNYTISEVQKGLVERVYLDNEYLYISSFSYNSFWGIDEIENYEHCLRNALSQCDKVVYIINAGARTITEDCIILKKSVLSVCNQDKLILVLNKIDTIGEPELIWKYNEDIGKFVPDEKCIEVISQRCSDMINYLSKENVIRKDGWWLFYRVFGVSAINNYNTKELWSEILRENRVRSILNQMIPGLHSEAKL